jgi:hypothetical protein
MKKQERIALSEKWMTREHVRTPSEAIGYCASIKGKDYHIQIQSVEREAYGDAEGTTVFGYVNVAYGTRVSQDESATLNAKWRIKHNLIVAERNHRSVLLSYMDGSGSSEQVKKCADDLAYAQERFANPASVELERELILATREVQ